MTKQQRDRTRQTTMAELALPYPNCHRAIHARRPWLTVDELKALIVAGPFD